MASLKSFLPKDIETLLALKREEVAVYGLRRYLNHLSQDQHQDKFHRDNTCGLSSLQDYQPDHREEVSNALVEAWTWLERENYLAPVPGSIGGWVRLTKEGKGDKDSIDWEVFIKEKSGLDPKAKTYAPGDAYTVYRDLKEIIGAAKKSIFIIDKYADEEIFDLYLDKCNPGIQIRLLTDSPPSTLKALKTVIGKFTLRPGAQFEARLSKQVHDRVIFLDDLECCVIGQSIKDATVKKPTYLVRLPMNSVSDMKKLYEDLWLGATSI